ncbi:MAG: Uma2 family endonuclease [Pirellula sp.]|jgi:Uma2 family endonuclease
MKSRSNELVREESEAFWMAPKTFRVAESFEEFVALNPDLMVEQNANWEILIESPSGSEGASREIEISFQLQSWTRTNHRKAFSASVFFTLPDGLKRGPDASWIATERWESLSIEDRASFAPISPISRLRDRISVRDPIA